MFPSLCTPCSTRAKHHRLSVVLGLLALTLLVIVHFCCTSVLGTLDARKQTERFHSCQQVVPTRTLNAVTRYQTAQVGPINYTAISHQVYALGCQVGEVMPPHPLDSCAITNSRYVTSRSPYREHDRQNAWVVQTGLAAGKTGNGQWEKQAWGKGGRNVTSCFF